MKSVSSVSSSEPNEKFSKQLIWTLFNNIKTAVITDPHEENSQGEYSPRE